MVEGRSGGLALFCKKNVKMELKFVDKNLFDCWVQFDSFSFYISCVYGDPMFVNRPKIWERLSRIGVNRQECWCMLGDFNDILHNGEKSGGPLRKETTFIPFRDMIKACQMTELSSTGNALTWGGKRNDMWIQCQLDRCFGNKEWNRLFPASNQAFLDKRGSNHRSVLVSLVASQDTYRGQFKFDRRFLHQPNIKKAISLAWNSPHSLVDASVSHRIRLCRRALSKLKKLNSLNSKSRILDLHSKLEREQSSDFPNFNHLHLLKLDIMKAYKDEESFWSQKSKERWANSGDKNTKFFHASVKANRAKKSIEMLLDGDGRENRSEASKGMVAVDFFTSLFSSTNPSDFSELFQDFIPRVTHSMNVELIRNVTSSEVK